MSFDTDPGEYECQNCNEDEQERKRLEQENAALREKIAKAKEALVYMDNEFQRCIPDSYSNDNLPIKNVIKETLAELGE